MYVYKIYDIMIGIMETVQIPAWVMQAVDGKQRVFTASIQITYSLVY